MSAAPPVLLSLDTATDRIHAALSVGHALHVRDLPGGAQASATLLPALAELLQEAGLAWADVDAIGFGSGPGAFTGLCTACSVAQGLALALGCPVIALDTLMAVAEDARQAHPGGFSPGDTLWVLQDARMSELYAGAFTWDGRRWAASEPAQLWPLDEPARRWAPGSVCGAVGLRWAGNAGAVYPDVLAPILSAQRHGGGDMLSASASASASAPAPAPGSHRADDPPVARTAGIVPDRAPSGQSQGRPLAPAAPRGPALAALAQAAWADGATIDAALALPRYVRDKVAQTTAERAAGRASAELAR